MFSGTRKYSKIQVTSSMQTFDPYTGEEGFTSPSQTSQFGGKNANLSVEDSLKSFSHLIEGFDFSDKVFTAPGKHQKNDENDKNLANENLPQAGSQQPTVGQSFRELFCTQIMQNRNFPTCATIAKPANRRKVDFLGELPNPDVISRRKKVFTQMPFADSKGKRAKDTFGEHLREINRRCSMKSEKQLGLFTPAGSLISGAYPYIQREQPQLEIESPMNHMLKQAMQSTTTNLKDFETFFVNPKFSDVIRYNPGSGQLKVLPAFSRMTYKNDGDVKRQKMLVAGEFDSNMENWHVAKQPKFQHAADSRILTENFINLPTQPYKDPRQSAAFPSPAFSRPAPISSRFNNNFDLTGGDSFNIFAAPPSPAEKDRPSSGTSWQPQFPKLWYV